MRWWTESGGLVSNLCSTRSQIDRTFQAFGPYVGLTTSKEVLRGQNVLSIWLLLLRKLLTNPLCSTYCSSQPLQCQRAVLHTRLAFSGTTSSSTTEHQNTTEEIWAAPYTCRSLDAADLKYTSKCFSNCAATFINTFLCWLGHVSWRRCNPNCVHELSFLQQTWHMQPSLIYIYTYAQ